MYYKVLLNLLNSKTGQTWQAINTGRLFIITCDYIYEDTKDAISIEILFNNITGIMNTDYVKTMAQIDSRFHKIGYYIKWWVNKTHIFTKQNKLNTFSLMCMLIVYLQDVAQPPVLPRIIEPYYNRVNLKWYVNPAYIEKERRPTCIENKIHVQQFSRNIEEIWKDSKQKDNLNTQSIDDLYRGFIDFYFNGGGFDHIHDVINTREGRIVKLDDIPDAIKDPVSGVDFRVRKGLRESIFGILDPFDFNYVPSKAFSLNYRQKDMVHSLAEFIQPEPIPQPKSSKKQWWKQFDPETYEF